MKNERTEVPQAEKKNRNRFNRLTSKEWLPFQKSWFRYQGVERLYRENIRFFVPASGADTKVYYYGHHTAVMDQIAAEENVEVVTDTSPPVQFALIDLRHHFEAKQMDYRQLKHQVIQIVQQLFQSVVHRRFMAVLIPNVQEENRYFPYAWDLAKQLSSIFSLKDEKIACIEAGDAKPSQFFQPLKQHFYCLYFRKDEHSNGKYAPAEISFFHHNVQPADRLFTNEIPSWFILKPQPRKKNEILHPAKYPEDLPEMFIREFTKEGDVVFDPMSGTGSTQLAALKLGRSGFGTELSAFFTDIANDRCKQYLNGSAVPSGIEFRIMNKDARKISAGDIPAIDYLVTSPPYWDMLNMKGAENQAKRIEKGLQLNYSDDVEDLGNIADYHQFVVELCNIYTSVAKLMKPGSYMTIVVKNIKKKGRNYPFAWDLAGELQKELILLPEVFWCQDDISIAPFGYGNTWVSNTFHQYCLTFRKPL